MDFTEVLSQLKTANHFDLYRIKVAIQNELENPNRVREIRQCFALGDQISYFCARQNKLCQGVVLEKNKKYVLVNNLENSERWNIPYYAIDLEGKDSDIRSQKREKLTKNHFKVGEWVGFHSDGKPLTGVIEKLNSKTVSMTTRENARWRVPYGLLFKVIEGEIGTGASGQILYLDRI